MEIWKVIDGFEDYEISNYGRVKYNKPKMKNTNGGILKPGKSKANDKGLYYCKVVLSQNGKAKTKQVHRLVAEAFIDNPSNKPEVNHIDNDGTNNNYTNLEWATNKEKYDKLAGTVFGEVKAIRIWKPVGKGLRADYLCLKCNEMKLDKSFRKLHSGESTMCGNCAKRKVKI